MEASNSETIPAALKTHLFRGKQPPDLCADYDVIGFDADHCLVKYDIPQLARRITECYANDLNQNFGYPDEITQVPEEMLGISLNNLVWDIENRTLLKLGEGKRVLRALKGSRALEMEQVEALYGNPPVFERLNYPEQPSQLSEERGAHWTLMTYFYSTRAPVIAHGIDLMEQGLITGKSNLQFAQDVIQCGKRQFSHYSSEEVFSIDSYGSFFPRVREDPHTLIQPQPELRDILNSLRQRNVRLFLGTNSHVEYMDLIMSATLGPDWK